jgi:hypothetical protein
MLEESEIRAIATNIVQKAKATARVDQGTLKRSIAFTYVRGLVTFRQIYYGTFGDNSQLEDLAKKYMPRGVPYRIELTEFGGKTYEISRSKTGRRSQKSAVQAVNRSSSTNVKKLLQTINKNKDGDKEKE